MDNEKETNNINSGEGQMDYVTDQNVNSSTESSGEFGGQSATGATPEAEAATANQTEEPTDGVENHKVIATVSYILPILFFIPLLDDKSKNNPYAMFHANQQLILLIFIVVLQFIHGTLFMVLGPMAFFVVNLLNLAVIALVIYGAINAYKGEMKKLPVIGGFSLLK